MGWKSIYDSKVDPSGIKQHFTGINLTIHCCRYWKLAEWDYSNLSFPFWRLYYNSIEGASIQYKLTHVELNPSKVILIPPYTSFSTSLKNSHTERLSGNRIETVEELKILPKLGMIDHLFIHFNLGFQLDHLEPGFYVFDVNEARYLEIETIRHSIINSVEHLNSQQSLQVYALIIGLLACIDQNKWTVKNHDKRVIKVIEYIGEHYAETLMNEDLAAQVAMAPNSFLRLFKTEMGLTLQRYVQKVRIEKALMEMHNSNMSIEQIAIECGFSDRHHFSKVFKQVIGMPPGRFRQLKTYR